MKKNIKIIFITMLTLFVLTSTTCLAAGWWGNPGYQWGLKYGLTSVKTQKQLEKPITLNDYYNLVQKYLRMKNIAPQQDKIVQVLTYTDVYNGAIRGILGEIKNGTYEFIQELTPSQYREIDSLITHCKTSINTHANLLTRDEIKEIDLFLSLSRYRAAMLLSEKTKIEREYKNNTLYSLRNTKYANLLDYGILPMCGGITRETFLTMMYKLLSTGNSSDEAIIDAFYEAGVLEGKDTAKVMLALKDPLTYSEALAFLYRFETFEFETSAVEEEIIEK